MLLPTPAGVATYSQAGQNYGMALLWTLALLIPVLTIVTEFIGVSMAPAPSRPDQERKDRRMTIGLGRHVNPGVACQPEGFWRRKRDGAGRSVAVRPWSVVAVTCVRW
jgi:hypothetical protein